MENAVDPKRSALMARVRGKNSKPELKVRHLLYARGYRYRLHRKDLPGTPDLVFPGRRKVIFVHGCFWHHHNGCRKATIPKTREDFWLKKFRANKERDMRKKRALEDCGWGVAVVWECELANEVALLARLEEFLERKS